MVERVLNPISDLIDRLVDKVTMYRLLVYYLLALLAAAVVFAGFGKMPFPPLAIAESAAYLSLVCYVANKIFAYVWEVPTNPESCLITALILALIISPPASMQDYLFLTAAGGLAIATKYMLAIKKAHVFNPAAIAVVLTAFGAHQGASWWVDNTRLLPFVVIGGILVVSKIRRWPMVMVYFAATLVSIALFNLSGPVAAIKNTIDESAMFFLGFVMLVEPLTAPTTKGLEMIYGALVGFLMPPEVHVLGIYSTPELALVAGNIFTFVTRPRINVHPKLVNVVSWGPSVRDFVFEGGPTKFKPGQYMEFTLPHHKTDSRGARRYFTLASSPTEKHLHLGVKFYPEGSTFKKAMTGIKRGTPMAASGLGGDFTLPKDKSKKLVFIAGGIGITPFRSMVKYMLDSDDRRNFVMLYSEKTRGELAYADVFNEAQGQTGMRIVYTLTSPNGSEPAGFRTGKINGQMVAREIPDYLERTFYISGPHNMVVAVRRELEDLGVPERQIKVDFFPGYA
jgi:ferredoxin-NADP reductase/Na+-translocating ferredoxin:NAD+ oxidoreductase RnfD subunit